MNKQRIYKLISTLLMVSTIGCFVLVMAYFQMDFPAKSLKIAVLIGLSSGLALLVIKLFLENSDYTEFGTSTNNKNTNLLTEEETAIEKEKQINEQARLQKTLAEKTLQKIKREHASENPYDNILIGLAKDFEIVQGQYFLYNKEKELFELKGVYAYFSEGQLPTFKVGENLSGQVAKDKKVLNVMHIPDDYITILSGLGESTPSNLLIVPIVDNHETIAVVELASFTGFKTTDELTIKDVLELSCPLLNTSQSL